MRLPGRFAGAACSVAAIGAAAMMRRLPAAGRYLVLCTVLCGAPIALAAQGALVVMPWLARALDLSQQHLHVRVVERQPANSHGIENDPPALSAVHRTKTHRLQVSVRVPS
jgi:hypothetical protein